jgi:trimeric autotransporter adhesin
LNRLRWSSLALLAAISLEFAGCSSNALPSPTPLIATLSPGDITAGSDSFTLFISGTGLIKTSVGFLDGTARPSKFNNSTGELEVTIAADDVDAANSSIQITVVNPDPGGTSNALTFIVNPIDNGAPAITSFSPPSVAAGTAGPFTVSIAGTNFVPTAVANWNGSPRPTTFVSSTQITVDFTTQDLAAQGSGSVSVSNPAPGGGVSPSKDFPVN